MSIHIFTEATMAKVHLTGHHAGTVALRLRGWLRSSQAWSPCGQPLAIRLPGTAELAGIKATAHA